MDVSTWTATIGAGTRLKEVSRKLYASGRRALAHGTCPSVGIGGHCTIGGLGPTSRMWGAALDHILEVTVVTADSKIVTASETENSDLFFALRGAAAGYGIITEFKFRTQSAPDEAVFFTYSLPFSAVASMATALKDWQSIVSNQGLQRRLHTQIQFNIRGMIISGTFFGSLADFGKEDLAKRFIYLINEECSEGYDENPRKAVRKGATVKVVSDWMAMLRLWAGGPLLSAMSEQAMHFYHKSLSIRHGSLLSADTIEQFLEHVRISKKGTPFWFVIMDLTGGAVNDIPADLTAYPHRSTLFYIQTYAAHISKISAVTRQFVGGINSIVESQLPEAGQHIYPGYVDPELSHGPRKYWGVNLERLQRLKTHFDPHDLFHNPQSVTPAYISRPSCQSGATSQHQKQWNQAPAYLTIKKPNARALFKIIESNTSFVAMNENLMLSGITKSAILSG
jgi:FAD/FMN-containing dehydrogenase